MPASNRLPDSSKPPWQTLKGPAVANVGTDVGPTPSGN